MVCKDTCDRGYTWGKDETNSDEWIQNPGYRPNFGRPDVRTI